MRAHDDWQGLVTVALLGTDRRVPEPPASGALASLVLERGRTDPATVMLDQVAALTAVRRAALRPGSRPDAPAEPPHDPRPEPPAAAIAHHARIVAEWPVLDDEWLLAVLAGGWRLPRELVVPLLVRHRRDPARRLRVERAAGPLAGWLVEHLSHEVPGLAPTRRRLSAAEQERLEAEAASRPALALPPDLAAVLADPDGFATTVLAPLDAGRLGAAHRGVLVHLVAMAAPSQLPGWVHGLRRVHPGSPSVRLADDLADLAQLRHDMLRALEPPPTQPVQETT